MWKSHESQEIFQQANNYGKREEQSGWGSKAVKSRDI